MKRFKAIQIYLLLILILGVSFITGCGGGGGETGHWLPNSDTTAPTVSFTVPAHTATPVAIGNKLTATFSEAMNPLTITTATFTLKQGVTVVPGLVTYAGVTAVFNPNADLTASTLYTATITTGAQDLAGNTLLVNKVWTFTTGAAADTTRPTVTSTVSANNATGVAFNSNITATFSEAMDPLTITTTTFTLTQGVTPVAGAVTYAGVTATFNPNTNFSASTLYTATITTGAEDLAGNTLLVNKVWTFTTGATADTTRPTVTSTVPADLATGVALNTNITATFSEAMDPLTITTTTFTLTQGGTPVAGAVTYAGTTATFNPDANLTASILYTATITTGAEDLAGNTLLVNKVWTFTPGATADTTAPTVTLTAPADVAAGVALNSTVNATFSEAMDPLTITTTTFTLTQGGTPVAGAVTYAGTTATFNPDANLTASTLYTATITTGAEDLAGNALVVPAVGGLPKPNPWTFTTGTGLAPGAVPLASAAPYGTFGGTAGMTNTGVQTVINGDIGTTATGAVNITGFHDLTDTYTITGANHGLVNGTLYTCAPSDTNPVNITKCVLATQARLDTQTAYLALAAMPSVGVLAGNLAGTTINPGVYTNSSSVLIQGGDLTLDALGDANGVFVFQIGSTLTVGGPGAAFPQSIILAGGAQAKNVFWQVGTSATINAAGGGTMEGTIIANSGVTFSTVGNTTVMTLNGRAMSLISSVTMVDTVINVPAP